MTSKDYANLLVRLSADTIEAALTGGNILADKKLTAFIAALEIRGLLSIPSTPQTQEKAA